MFKDLHRSFLVTEQSCTGPYWSLVWHSLIVMLCTYSSSVHLYSAYHCTPVDTKLLYTCTVQLTRKPITPHCTVLETLIFYFMLKDDRLVIGINFQTSSLSRSPSGLPLQIFAWGEQGD